MPIVPIENVGRAGLVLDIPAAQLPPEAWTSVLNMRFQDGKVFKSPGNALVYDPPSIAPHSLLYWNTTGGPTWIYAGTTTVYTVSGVTHTNITRYTTTPGDDNYNAGSRPTWTGGILHGVPILNNDGGVDPPQYYNSASSRLANLSNWPASTYCKVIRPYGNFLIALWITESGTEYPYMIRWSHPADPGTVPSTWDYTDATKLAGRHTIAESGGFLVESKPLGANNYLYKEDAIWMMQPANLPYVFSFAQVSNSVGALNTNCIAQFYSQHFIVGKTDIYIFDGVTPRPIMPSRLRSWFFNTLDTAYWDKTFVVPSYATQEMMVFFVEAGNTSGFANKCLIWNWQENTFTVKDMPDIVAGAFGVVETSVTDETYDGVGTGTFDADNSIFGDPGTSPADLQVLLAKNYSSNELIQEYTTYQDRGNGYTSYLERTDLTITGRGRDGAYKSDPSSVKFLRGIYPKIEAADGTVINIYAGASNVPGGGVSWQGPFQYIVGTHVKADFALSGKYLAVKFEDTGSTAWSLTGYDLDLDVISRL